MKITLSRIFEISKALTTAPGQELQDFIDFVAQFAEQTLRALRNGLTFDDNVRCMSQRISLTNLTDQLVNTGSVVPNRVLVTRVYSTKYSLASWLWFLDNAGRLTVRCGFTPIPTEKVVVNGVEVERPIKVEVDLLIFYE
jgi:hypothetical protein